MADVSEDVAITLIAADLRRSQWRKILYSRL